MCRGEKEDDDETDAETAKLRGALTCEVCFREREMRFSFIGTDLSRWVVVDDLMAQRLL